MSRVSILLSIVALLAAGLQADERAINRRAATNNETGFVPEKAYQFDGIDTVNLFNGNLILSIPIGGSYPVSSQLSYGLRLHYNSKIWKLIEGGRNTCYVGQPSSLAAFPADTVQNTSAGLGWTLSLGQFKPKAQNPTSLADWYVSPDGATHEFRSRQILDPALNSGYVAVSYTSDGTHLRLKQTTGGEFDIEFPDGTIHRFHSDGFLASMKDRFGNEVRVTNAVVNGKRKWTFEDDYRVQTITFRNVYETLTDPTRRFDALEWIVESVDVRTFTAEGSNLVARYDFEYDFVAVGRGCAPGDAFDPCASSVQVPLLKRVKLPITTTTDPNQTGTRPAYELAYNTSTTTCGQGTLRALTYPVGGRIEWQYGTYQMPANGCFNPYAGSDWRNTTEGVTKKTLFDHLGIKVGEWTYQQKTGPEKRHEGLCGDDVEPPGGGQPVPISHYGYEHVTNTVTDPLGRRSVHYFATWNDDFATDHVNIETDYGLPYTRVTSAANAPGSRFLSRDELCESGTGGTGEPACVPRRRKYVQYDTASCPPDFDSLASCSRRPIAEHDVFLDDLEDPAGAPVRHFVDTAWSDFDGYGHYRKTESASTFGPKRTTVRNYNAGSDATGHQNGVRFIGPGAPWLLNRYTEELVTEGAGTLATNVCIDATSGVLRGQRWLRSGSVAGSTDVAVRYSYDGAGNATLEDWYGGDNAPLSSSDLCTTSGAGISTYQLAHGYTAGVRRISTYRNATFNSLDVTVDTDTGLASAGRDVAGIETKYGYDVLGRLRQVRPAGEAWTEYTYDLISRPAAVIARTYGASITDTANATPLREQRFYYDGLGRLIQSRHRMPDRTDTQQTIQQWATVAHTYDAAGQRTSTSMPQYTTASAFAVFTPAHVTAFAYDAFGRVVSVTTPDSKTSTTSYLGIRQIERTVDVDGTSAVTREQYDAHGRLIAVTEDAGDGRANIRTSYGYDTGSRLVSVSTTAGNTTQTRSFTYDGRGFLTSEKHPEKGATGNGTVTYSGFDARGHATRRIDGTANGRYDLNLTYDHAERLTKVEDLAVAGQRRTLKELVYATANDPANCTAAPCNARNGKLVTARRYNAVPDLGTVEVAEEYRYDGLGGRPTKRTTTVTGTASFSGAQFETSQGWDELGNLVSITYPSTGAVAPARTVNYTHKHGFLTEVVGYGTIAYHPTATVAKVTHGNTVSETTDLHTGMPRPLRIKATSAGGATLWQTGDYEYDGAGNITEVGDTAYDYDAMNRLTAWTVSSPGWSHKTVRTLDAFGNATRTTSLGCPEPASGLQDCFETSFGRSVDAATNHYDFQTYDDAGSVIADGVHSFTYDGAAMPVSVSSDLRNDRFLYTADDERLAIVSRVPSSGGTRNRTTWTLRGTSNQLLRTFTDDATSGTRIWSWTEDEIWRGGQILASESPGSTKHYYLDHLGSPRFIADAAGNRLGEQNYGPFGGGGTSDGGRIQFTGHEVDSDRLTYMHARYYDGGVGRFLSVDPYLDINEALHEPQLWNRYSYVTNNPLKFTDPDGRYRTFYKEKPMHTMGNNAPPVITAAMTAQAGLLGLAAGSPLITRAAPYVMSLLLALAPRAPQVVEMFGPPGTNVITPGNVGMWREEVVAQSVGGAVSGAKLTVKGVGSTDIDVIGKAGEYIAVGGPAKGFDLAKFGQKLDILKRGAAEAGVVAKAYLAEGTSQKAIDLAKKHLGADNVVVFRVVQ